MSCEKIRLVVGDNLPVIKLALKNYDETPLDVSGATVVVYFRPVGQPVVSALPCTYVGDGTDGLVQFSFPGTALQVPPGSYEGEVECDFGGAKQTVYEVLRFTVRQQFQ